MTVWLYPNINSRETSGRAVIQSIHHVIYQKTKAMSRDITWWQNVVRALSLLLSKERLINQTLSRGIVLTNGGREQAINTRIVKHGRVGFKGGLVFISHLSVPSPRVLYFSDLSNINYSNINNYSNKVHNMRNSSIMWNLQGKVENIQWIL